MYSLTIQHDLQTIHIKWDLEPLDPDDDYNIIFTNFSFTAQSSDYNARLLEENTSIGVYYKNIQIAQIHFHSERLIYFLQFIQSGAVVREFYLEEDVLEAKKKYAVVYDVMYAS
jgi:hypothetical protein